MQHVRTGVCIVPHTLSILSVANILLSVDIPVLLYFSCCMQRHTFTVTCNVKNYFLNFYASVAAITTLFTYNYAVLLNTIRDRHVISDCRGPETARTTCVYKCIEYKPVVILESFYKRRQMKES